MTAIRAQRPFPDQVPSAVLKRQLIREIAGLERKLALAIEQARQNPEDLETFNAMLACRRRMLDNMPLSD